MDSGGARRLYRLATRAPPSVTEAGQAQGYPGEVWARLESEWIRGVLDNPELALRYPLRQRVAKYDHETLLVKAATFRDDHAGDLAIRDVPAEERAARKAKTDQDTVCPHAGCGLRFSNKGNTKAHSKTCSKSPHPPPDNLCCDDCKRTHTSKRSLARHKKRCKKAAAE